MDAILVSIRWTDSFRNGSLDRRSESVWARADASCSARAMAASDLAPLVVEVDVQVLAPDAAEVVVVLQVDYVFARAIPGAADGTTVEARAAAEARP